MAKVIEGNWDELVGREDLRGRRVRITVLDDEPDDDAWSRQLRAWAARQKQPEAEIDDGRDGMYPGSGDDPEQP